MEERLHVGEEGRAKLIQSVICTSIRLAKERHMSQLAIKAAVVRQAFGNLLGQVRIRARAKSQVVDELMTNLCLDGPARWDADLVQEHGQEKEQFFGHKDQLVRIIHGVILGLFRQKVKQLEAIQEREKKALGRDEGEATLLEEQILVVHDVAHPHRVAIVICLRPDCKSVTDPNIAANLSQLDGHTHRVFHESEHVVFTECITQWMCLR